MSTTQAYRNLWEAIQDIDTPKEEHLTIKTQMVELHAQIPSEEFNVLADELPGYRAFQVRVHDMRASKFPSEEYDTSDDTTVRFNNKTCLSMWSSEEKKSEFLKWKRAHFRHLDKGEE